jgi:hypothetical protein
VGGTLRPQPGSSACANCPARQRTFTTDGRGSRPASGRDSIEVEGFILQLGEKTKMGNLLLAIMLFITVPVTVIAGPKEDAYQIVEKFERAFDASDVQGIVNLFAPDAVFLGTVSALLEVWMASRTDADIRRVFARLEGVNERVHYESMVNMFGRKAVESTEALFLMDGVGYLLRGLALQNKLQKKATQDKRWLYWRGEFARDILNCNKQGS